MSFPAFSDPSFLQFCINWLRCFLWNVGKCFQASEVSQENKCLFLINLRLHFVRVYFK